MYRTSLPSHDPTESRFSWPAVSSRNLKFAKSQVEGLKSQNHLIAHAHLKMPFESSYMYIYIYIYTIKSPRGPGPPFHTEPLKAGRRVVWKHLLLLLLLLKLIIIIIFKMMISNTYISLTVCEAYLLAILDASSEARASRSENVVPLYNCSMLCCIVL